MFANELNFQLDLVYVDFYGKCFSYAHVRCSNFLTLLTQKYGMKRVYGMALLQQLDKSVTLKYIDDVRRAIVSFECSKA